MAIERYAAACCSIDMPNPLTREGIGPRVKRMLEMVDFAVAGYAPFFDVRLVVFPEFAHAAPVYDAVEALHEKLAVEVPNEWTDLYAKKARQHGIYIQTGTFLEKDARWPGHVFNATCLVGPDGLLTKYRKVNPWIPWEVHTSPHDLPGYDQPLFPVAATEIGNLGVAICYDWVFPEPLRQLTLQGAEVLIRVSAYMDPWGTEAPMDWWTVMNRARAIENVAAVVACNQGSSLASYPPFSWPGGNMVVDFDGRVLAQAERGPGERILVGPVDLAALRAARERRRGHMMPAHLRTEAYPGYRGPIYPAGTARTAPPTIATQEANIVAGRARLNEAAPGG
jgi:predicted amidohydrolase